VSKTDDRKVRTEKQGVCMTCGELVPQGCCTCGPRRMLWPVGVEQCEPFIEEAESLVQDAQSFTDELAARSYLLCLRQWRFQLWCMRQDITTEFLKGTQWSITHTQGGERS
jgi:hypothetical protein